MSHSALLLQLVIILGTALVLGALFRRCGQPGVVGEMAAGLLLGPLAFGALTPDLQAAVFAPASLAALDGLSQLGLVLFMFVVGAEIRLPARARDHIVPAVWIGALSVLLPMVLGLAVAVPLYPALAPPGVQFGPFALFLAAAMSVTAFPVLARILKERRATQTLVGRLALTSAAVSDVLAWALLALVVVLANGSRDWEKPLRMLIGVIVLLAVLFGAVRPLLSRLLGRHATDVRPEGAVLALLLIGAFACAFVTHWLGVHAVFGAFLFGACLPCEDRLVHSLVERVEHVTLLVLLPVFFALAGLATTAGAFRGAGAGALFLVLAAAVVGKIAGAGLGARIAGQPWRVALAVGSLMNARGLIELIVLKVGVDIGVIGPELFTILFVMTLVTTLMASPLLTLFSRGKSLAEGGAQRVS